MGKDDNGGDEALKVLLAVPLCFIVSFVFNVIATPFALIFWNGWLSKNYDVPQIGFWQLFGGLTLLSLVAGYLKMAFLTKGK